MPTDLAPALHEAVEVMAEAIGELVRPGTVTVRDLATAALRARGWSGR